MKKFAEKYQPLLRSFASELLCGTDAEQYAGIPSAMLPAWGKHYDDALIKIAIIGKETRGWKTDLPEQLRQLAKGEYEPTLEMGDFQNLDYLSWGAQTRFRFWGLALYLLSAVYGVKNWEVLKRSEHEHILNSFLWGNVYAIETTQSAGIDKATWNSEAHARASAAAAKYFNDYKLIYDLKQPDITFILCSDKGSNDFLRNIEKESIAAASPYVTAWRTKENKLIIRMPHPGWFLRNGHKMEEICSIVDTIRQILSDEGAIVRFRQFMDLGQYDVRTDAFIGDILSRCRKQTTITREALKCIALELSKQQAKMSVRMLFTLLNKFGYRTTYGTEYACGRGSYKAISSAYKYYETHAQEDVAQAIAEAFTKPDGSYAYDY